MLRVKDSEILPNAVVFEPQSRKLSSRAIASSYLGILDGLAMDQDLMRHTMLVTPKPLYPGLGPGSKSGMVVDVLPHKLFEPRYSLVNIGRIKPWDSPNLPDSYFVSLRNSLPDPRGDQVREQLAIANAYAAHG